MVISFMAQKKNEFENCHLKYSRSTLKRLFVFNQSGAWYAEAVDRAVIKKLEKI